MIRAFDKADVPDAVRHVSDVPQSTAYLRGEGPFGDRESYPKPSLILLDLHLPGCSGLPLL